MTQTVKRLPAMRETWVRSPGWEDLLEKEMATHFSILAWKIPRTEAPLRLQSMGSPRPDATERLHFHFGYGAEKTSEETQRLSQLEIRDSDTGRRQWSVLPMTVPQ